MPKITVLPHATLCPEGKVIDAQAGVSVLDNCLAAGIAIEHACEKACACTTCHVIVRQGYASLGQADEFEDDLLDKAWGLTSVSRLSCQAQVGDIDITVEIPKYTLNHASEGSH